MQNAFAKYRALIALILVALMSASGCKPPSPAASVEKALQAAQEEGPHPFFANGHPPFGATGSNAAGWLINTTGNLVTPSGKVIEGLRSKTSVAATATANVATLSGLATTVDTIALSHDGVDAVLLTNQTTTSQIGCWIVHSGAWTRCLDAAAGAPIAGSYFPSGGSTNKGLWLVTNTTTTGIVGTDVLTFQNLVSGGASGVTSVNGNAGPAVVLTASDVGFPTIRLMTATALPAGTYSNGPGTYVVTATGVCAAIDGVTPALNDVVANQNDTGVANGIYKITQNSGGTQCTFTRDVNYDTAAEIQGASFSVRDGTLHGGGTYRYPPANTHPLTLGTSTFFATRLDMRNSPTEGFACTDELTMVSTPTVNVSWPGPCGFEPVSNTITVALVASASGIFGGLSFTTAASATAYGGLGGNATGNSLNGASFIFGTNDRAEFRARSQVLALSTGTQRFAVNVGYSHDIATSQVIPPNGMAFVYDDATSANWRACCSTASTPVCTDTGVVVAATTTYNFHAVHEAGAPNMWFDVTSGSTAATPVSVAWSACPAGVTVQPVNMAYNAVGTGAGRGTLVDSFHVNGFYPLGR